MLVLCNAFYCLQVFSPQLSCEKDHLYINNNDNFHTFFSDSNDNSYSADWYHYVRKDFLPIEMIMHTIQHNVAKSETYSSHCALLF